MGSIIMWFFTTDSVLLFFINKGRVNLPRH